MLHSMLHQIETIFIYQHNWLLFDQLQYRATFVAEKNTIEPSVFRLYEKKHK